jgi:polar amino acid transport system substrate-binding protein
MTLLTASIARLMHKRLVMLLRFLIASLVFFCTLAGAQSSGSMAPAIATREKVVISCSYGTVDTEIIEVILREAYWRIGKELVIERLPGERSLVNANNGEVQGDCQRMEGISTLYSNLTPIYPSINKMRTVLLTLPGSDIRALSDLKDRPVGHLRGIKIAEKIASDNKLKTITSANYENLISMLKNNRIEAILISDISAKIEWGKFNNGNIDNINIVNLNIEYKLYHYLHKATLPLIAEPLQNEFIKMQKNGQIDAIIKHVQDLELARVKNKLLPCQSYTCLEEGLPFLSKKPDTFSVGK